MVLRYILRLDMTTRGRGVSVIFLVMEYSGFKVEKKIWLKGIYHTYIQKTTYMLGGVVLLRQVWIARWTTYCG
jgi:hypothetical protein